MKIRLALSSVLLDESTQCRERTDPALVEEYAAAYRREEALPPPDVFGPLFADALPPGAKVWIGDGHTRVRGALQAGLTDLECEVHAGGEEDAFAWALRANRHHGARVTPADKRHAVRKALERWPGLSDREIGRRADVGYTLVASVRSETTARSGQSEEKRTGADGRVRRLPQRTEPAAAAEPGPLFPVGLPGATYQPILGGEVGADLAGKPLRAAPGAVTIVDEAPVASIATSNEVEEQATPPAAATPPPTAETPNCEIEPIVNSGPGDLATWQRRAETAEARVRELEQEAAMERSASCGACELAAERIAGQAREIALLRAKVERLTEATAGQFAGEEAPPAPLRVALVGCGSKKLDHAAPARELYTGPLFRAALAYADDEGFDAIFVLSAKHGLLGLGQEIEPYDLRIEGLSEDERHLLSIGVVRALRDQLEQDPAEITVLAAEGYVALLDGAPWKVHAPLAGMQIGERLAWLKQQREEEPAQAPLTGRAAAKAARAALAGKGPPVDLGGAPAADTASACTRCGAEAGKPCTNYKGQRKPPCKGRGVAATPTCAAPHPTLRQGWNCTKPKGHEPPHEGRQGAHDVPTVWNDGDSPETWHDEPPAPAPGIVQTWGRCYAPGCARAATSIEHLPGLGEKRPVCPGHGGQPAQAELTYEREPAPPKPARKRRTS